MAIPRVPAQRFAATSSHGAFVGRHTERRRIQRLLTHPDRPVVVLTGAPGIGKTRLAREIVDHAPAHLSTFWAHADPADRDVPFSLFQHHGDPDVTDPLRRLSDLLATFSNVDRPCLLAVDDAHLADDMSLFLIHQLATDSAARLILTIRTGEEIRPAVTELLALDRVDHTDLPGFTLDDAVEFVSSRGADPAAAQALWLRSGGNPLFLRTLVESSSDAAETVPDDLRAAVESMLHRNSDVGLDLLIDVLAEAESLPLNALTQITGSWAVEAAEARGLVIVAPGGGWPTRLAHPLYGEVHRGVLTDTRRRAIRAQVIDVLGDDPQIMSDDGYTLRLAMLAADTDDSPRRDALLLRGAEAALSVLDMPLAATLSEQVSPTGAHCVQASILHGYALAAFGDAVGAERVFDALISTDPAPDLHETIGLIRTGGNLWAGDDPEPLRALGDHPETTPETRATINGFLAALAGDPVQALRSQPVDPAPPADRGRIDADGVNGLIAAIARITAAGERGDHDALLTAVAAGYRQLEGSVMAASQQTQLSTAIVLALSLSGDADATAAALDSLAPRLSSFPGISSHCLQGLRATAAVASGDPQSGRDSGRAAVEGFDDCGAPGFIWYPFVLAFAEASAQTGDVATARRMLTRLRRNPHHGHRHLAIRLDLCEAWCAADRESAEAGAAQALGAARVARERGQHGLEIYCLQTALRFGSAAAAEGMSAAARAVPRMPRARLTFDYAAAVTAGDADALLRTARAFADHRNLAVAADTTAQAVALLLESGRPHDALDALAESHRLADTIGLRSPALRAADRVTGLSDRQRTIVAMARAGSSNKLIAETLSVSVRTVEGHLYRVARTLGGPVRTAEP